MRNRGKIKSVRGRREVYEHLDAFLRLSYTERGIWLGEALALVDAVRSGRAGRKPLVSMA